MKHIFRKEKKSGKAAKAAGIVLSALLVTFLVIVAVWHDAASAVFWNLVTPTVKMDTSTTWDGGKSYPKVPYASVSSSDYVDIYVPDGVTKPPLFILVHGGGFVTNDSQSRQAQLMYRYFRDHGYACATVNYRLAQEASYPAALEDVKACIRFLKANADTYGYDPDRTAIFGESAGGYLAILAAVTNDQEFNELPYIGESADDKVSASVSALVDFYGQAEFGTDDAYWRQLHYPSLVRKIANEWVTKVLPDGYSTPHGYWIRKDESQLTKDELDKYSAYTYLKENFDSTGKKKQLEGFSHFSTDLSVYISHGDADMTVPVLVSEKLADRLDDVLGMDQVSLNIVHHSGHGKDMMYTDSQLSMVDDFLQQHM